MLVHAACGGNPFISSSGPPASVARIEIEVPSKHLVAGQTVQARARLLEASGNPLTGRSVTWSSSNDSVATVDRNGVISGISVGNATITAASEDRTGLVAMTVVPVPVHAVVVALSSGSIHVGQTAEATAVVRDASGNALAGRSVIWASSDRSVATVDRNGLVAGVSAGSVDVIGTSEGQSGSAVLTVSPVPVAVVEVALSSGAAFIGQMVLATATARDDAGNVLSDRAVTWSSSDPSVATVDGNGLVTVVASGAALIDAACEGVSGSAALFATSAPVAVVEVALLSGGIAVGEATQASATVRDAGGNVLFGRSVSWASSNTMVATVDGSGLVTAREVGSASITATGEGRSGSATLTVTPIPVARIDTTIASGSLFVGQTTRASATLWDASGKVLTGRAVTWASSNVAVATVDGSGSVSTLTPGVVSLTANCEGRSGSATLAVNPIPVASVGVTFPMTSVIVGQTAQATATVRDANGNVLTGRVMTWASSDTAVATVDGSGSVTTVVPGAISLTASCEGRSGSATLVVNPIPVATVSVVLAPTSVFVGQTSRATATLRVASGNVLTGRAVTWASSDTVVATVDGNGSVTTVVPGSVSVTASCEGRSGSATLVANPIPVATVSVLLAPTSVFVGQTSRATATLRDANGNVLTGRTVTWSSSNTAVATVDGVGLVTARGAGSASIRATSEGQSGSASLTAALVPVATVAVSLVPSTVPAGDTSQASATLRDAGGNVLSGRSISWVSQDTAVATVNAAGVVSAETEGLATIVATSEGHSGSAPFSVTPPPVNSVLVALDSVRLTVGDVTQSHATPLDARGNVLTGRSVSWGSRNTSIATVSGSGRVTARGTGYVSITATSEGRTGSGTLAVVLPGATSKTILVIGPHPDDETLIAAGRTRRAVNAGDVVKVVVVTNGDQHGYSAGLTREGESVAAAMVLGLGEEDVIFLGYPDTLLNNIYTASSGTQIFTGNSGRTTTYGNRGLGGADYHTYLTGAAGSYNRNTMRQDFEALIRNYRPDEIYTVTEYDEHTDHLAVALFVQDALTTLSQSAAISSAQLFQSIVWVPGGSDWPMVDNSGFTPTIPFREPPTLSSQTPLSWSDIYRFPVPTEMLSTDPATSMKYQAILRYQSQRSNWLTSFARADEFFWLTSY